MGMTDQGAGKKDGCPCGPGMTLKDGKCVMPDVTLTSFVMALNSSALAHLGELVSPESGTKQQNMMLAKHTIDTIAMLQAKTRGNLSHEEAELIETSLFDLKMRFVKARS